MAVDFTGGVIGRMFAKQTVPELYKRQKTVNGEDGNGGNHSVDMVDLSPAAPKPLEAKTVEDAAKASDAIRDGANLTREQQTALREDRIFVALSSLLALGADPDAGKSLNWPAGLPGPTGAEMQVAYRRLSQRPRNLDDADSPDEILRRRAETLENLRDTDFSRPAAWSSGVKVAGLELMTA